MQTAFEEQCCSAFDGWLGGGDHVQTSTLTVTAPTSSGDSSLIAVEAQLRCHHVPVSVLALHAVNSAAFVDWGLLFCRLRSDVRRWNRSRGVLDAWTSTLDVDSK